MSDGEEEEESDVPCARAMTSAWLIQEKLHPVDCGELGWQFEWGRGRRGLCWYDRDD